MIDGKGERGREGKSRMARTHKQEPRHLEENREAGTPARASAAGRGKGHHPGRCLQPDGGVKAQKGGQPGNADRELRHALHAATQSKSAGEAEGSSQSGRGRGQGKSMRGRPEGVREKAGQGIRGAGPQRAKE